MSGIDFLLENGCCLRCSLIYCGIRNFDYFNCTAAVESKVEEVRRLPSPLDALDFNAPAAFESPGLSTHSDGTRVEGLEDAAAANGHDKNEEAHLARDKQEGSVLACHGGPAVCISCLGLLQPYGASKLAVEQVCERATAEDYDTATFSLSLSLPVSVTVRAYVITAHLCRLLSKDANKALGAGVTAAIKDAWKAMVAAPVESSLQKRYGGDTADLSVPCAARYPPDALECTAAMAAVGYLGPTVKKQRNRRQRFCKRPKRDDSTSSSNGICTDAGGCDEAVAVEDTTGHEADDVLPLTDPSNNLCAEQKASDGDTSTAGYSRQTVTSVLSNMTAESVSRLCPLSTIAAPQTPLSLVPEAPVRESIFVAGRYCKYSRELCQTPWVINGEAKCSESVEELMAGHVLPACRAQELKFLSSGREDVDVRCIGRGRPFALALLNPRRAALSPAEVLRIQNAINAGTQHISVSHLQIVDKESTSVLRFNQEDKVKCYTALCFVREGGPCVGDSFLQPLRECAPLTILQQTPVRVLHRRPLLTRPRVLHTMSAQRVNDTFFKVHLRTEAGTYIKELVHGDFGRTTPSLSSLLGCPVDILALDVTDVELDWPPAVNSGACELSA